MQPKFAPTHYLSINSVRTNGPIVCPIVWLPYAPKYVDKPLREACGFVYVNKIREPYGSHS